MKLFIYLDACLATFAATSKPNHYHISLYLWFHVYTIAVACSDISLCFLCVPILLCTLVLIPLRYILRKCIYTLHLTWSMSLIALAMIMVPWNYECKYKSLNKWCILHSVILRKSNMITLLIWTSLYIYIYIYIPNGRNTSSFY